LAILQHLKAKYGIVPDLWEMIVEPDNTDRWDGEAMGRRMVATARRLRKAGFPIRFVAPSTGPGRRTDSMCALPLPLPWLPRLGLRSSSVDVSVAWRAARRMPSSDGFSVPIPPKRAVIG